MGLHQRLRSAPDLVGHQAHSHSALATLLIQLWSWGEISTPIIQQIANAAKKDFEEQGCEVPTEVDKIASIGSYGLHTSHCHRDLTQYRISQPVFGASLVSVLTWAQLSFMRLKQVSHSYLLPHVLFAQMYESCHEAFVDRILGGHADRVGEFWRGVSQTSKYRNHPLRRRRDHMEKCVPLGIHADGVTTIGVSRSWSKNCEAFSWSSCLSCGPTKIVIFLIYLIFKSTVVASAGRDTMGDFWKLLTWSLFWLYRGTWPTHDSDDNPIHDDKAGKPLAGGFYAALWVTKADLDFYANSMSLESVGARDRCIKCRGNTTTIPWTEVHPERSAWLAERWTAPAWAAAHPNVPKIFTLPGVTIDTVCIDWMHCKHLGVDSYMFGSALMMLTHPVQGHQMMPASPADNMQSLWCDLKRYSREMSIEGGFGEIRTSMFLPAERFPMLKGKAGEIKALGRPLLKAWELKMSRGNKQHRLVRLALQSSVDLEVILDRSAGLPCLIGDDKENFTKACWDLGACLTALGSHYHGLGEWLFHFTMKMHYIIHQGLDCGEVSPRLGWCYQGEDMMQKVKSLVASCSRGTPTHLVPAKVMTKYVIALSYSCMLPEGWWR